MSQLSLVRISHIQHYLSCATEQQVVLLYTGSKELVKIRSLLAQAERVLIALDRTMHSLTFFSKKV
jgi:hypothetical protein